METENDIHEAPDTNMSFKERVDKDTKRVFRYPDTMGSNDGRAIIKEFFERIVSDLGITHARWRQLMTYYLEDPLNQIPNNRESHVQARSNLNKNFVTSGSMTWVMLCKALRFIRIKRFRFSLTLVHSNDTTTEHGVWVNLRNQYHLTDEEDNVTLLRIPSIEIRDGDSTETRGGPFAQQSAPINFSQYEQEFPKLAIDPEGDDD